MIEVTSKQSKILFLLLVYSFSLSSFSNEKLKYNQRKSISFNEKNFLTNLSKDCKNFGYNRDREKNSPVEVLETYPKEVSYLYFKKHINDLCYYAVSHITKYIVSDFKDQVESVLLGSVKTCFDEKKALTSNNKAKLCAELDTKAVLFDLTILLGTLCTKESLNLFKSVHCRFKEVGDRECRIYQDSSRPLDKCPFHFSNSQELDKLHKSYFGSHCKSKERKWTLPKCI